MLDKWDYTGVSAVCYSDSYNQYSYIKPAEFLGNGQVEDWGGGTGWAKKYFSGPYKNIDGSKHPNVDVVTDLTNYVSKCDNILMRQVLEFNWNWEKILTNVKKSFQKKFCLVVMTPLVTETHIDKIDPVVNHLGEELPENNTPNIFFNKQDILKYFPASEGYKVSEELHDVDRIWPQEWILYVEKIS